MTKSNVDNLEAFVEGPLASEVNPTPKRIRELIQQVRILPSCLVTDEEAEMLARRFEERHGVTMSIGAMLTEREHEPWLDDAQTDIDPYYWTRYRKLLQEKHFSGQVIAGLDEVTDRTLGILENPHKTGPWDRRGMVVGHVQSGKTANYTGLMCKAADAGYRLIIVIAGIHNNLRNQTQLRIDEGFVGRDSARLLSQRNERFVGVGRFDNSRRPVTFTNSVRDFNKDMATGLGIPLQNLNEPAVFVIKKNASTLKHLIDWLTEHSITRHGTHIDTPMLLIDDEADNASVNIKYGKDEVSRINGQIRGLLKLFERSCYIGYTATPFANIFIDPESVDEMLGDDLFPRHFIISLDPPSNYFGANRVFLEDTLSIVRHIEDNEDVLPLKHTIDTEIVSLPESLVTAIRTFIIGRAIRLARGHDGSHNSMLVNASRFTDVQRQLRNEIHTCLEGIQASLRINGALSPDKAENDAEIAALHSVWREEYQATGIVWSDVLLQLYEAAAPIKVVEVNSRSSGRLDYSEYANSGLNVIAVGGFSLSRGLTLEGLMVSYFLRNSMMYDTLMQMGRWFGFRPGYDDLCRVWMQEEAEGWYAHIADSIEMLRAELRNMEASGATPEEFGLKVRSHPDTLMVTARNKLGSGERIVVSIGLGNSFVETHILKQDEASLDKNRKVATRLVNRLAEIGHPISTADTVSGSRLLRRVSVDPILEFISTFEHHPGAMLSDPVPVCNYIKDRRSGELAEWDVLFAGLKQLDKDGMESDLLGSPIYCQRRGAGKRSDSRTLLISNKQRVASRGIERIGLTDADIQYAELKYRRDIGLGDNTGANVNYPDRIYRPERIRPLLIVHLLKIDPPKGRSHSKPVVAWSLSFPKTDLEEKRVEYLVNTTWLLEHYRADIEDDDLGDDDE